MTFKPRADRKVANINIRIAEKAKALIEAKAKVLKMTVSSYLEMLITNDITTPVASVISTQDLERRLRAPKGSLESGVGFIADLIKGLSGVRADQEWVMRTGMLAEALAAVDPDGLKWYPVAKTSTHPREVTLWTTKEIVQTEFPHRRMFTAYLQTAIDPEGIDHTEGVVMPKDPEVITTPERPEAHKVKLDTALPHAISAKIEIIEPSMWGAS